MTQSAALERTVSALPPIDVSRAALYQDESWQEPFRQLRAQAPIQYVPAGTYRQYCSPLPVS